MKGIVFGGKGKVVTLDDISPPDLQPGDIMTRTRMTGITAGTELNFLLGGCYSRPWPVIPGYQNVGEVIKVTSPDSPLKVGQRVYSHYWYRPLRFTYEGKSYLQDETALGAGAHVEYRGGPPLHPNLIPLGDDISDEEAAFLSVVCIGMHGATRTGASIGKKVLVIGLGMIGQFAAQAARASGACVHALGRRRIRLDLAEKFSSERVFDAGDASVWGEIRKEAPYDIIIETTGSQDLDRALECLAGERNEAREMVRQGTLYLMGGRDTISYTNILAHRKEAILMHSSHHTRKEVDEALRLRRLGLLHIVPLITHRFTPDEAAHVYGRLLKGEPEMLGVVFKWS